MADYTLKALDTQPVLADTLTYSTGAAVDLTGATVKMVWRALTSATAAVNATATIVSAVAGTVSYTPLAADTAVAGQYMGSWVVTFAGGAVMTFPTVGYLDIVVEDSLIGAAQALVSVDEAKEYLRIGSTDRTHDQTLTRFIRAARPVVEFVTGPILVASFDEWYDGGSAWIVPRHRPVVTLVAVSEFIGPAEYALSIVADPAHGSIYSCMLDPDGGRIVRRSAGGAVQAFTAGPESVHVVYTAGRASVPENVRQATLELIRENYQQTQQGGRSTRGVGPNADVTGGTPELFMSDRVRQMLIPNRRAPRVF